MPRPVEDPAPWLLDALRRLDGQAIGLWRVGPKTLSLQCFQAPSLDVQIAERFASATASVSLDQTGLGIVQAARNGEPEVSFRDSLPAESGSGYWLRAFGSHRSVALPLQDSTGEIRWVLAIALGREPSESEVAKSLQEAAARYLAAS